MNFAFVSRLNPNRLCMTVMAIAFALSLTAQAQIMSSTAELKLACETSPDNVVTLNATTQISTGPQSPLTEIVNTKCTIVIGPQVTFEASLVSMTFNGPLSIQASAEGRALFPESFFVAPSVSVALGNLGGLLVERSRLRSAVGGISVTSDVESSVDVRGPIDGTESTINANEFNISSAAAGVFLGTGGSRGAVTMALGSISSGTATLIQSSLTGTGGKAVLQNATVSAGDNLRIETGGLGNSEVLDSNLTSNTMVRILSGAGGTCKSQNNVITAPIQQICL